MRISVVLTNEQLKNFKGRVLKESFVVNTALVNKIRELLKGYNHVVYDDIDENGDVVQRVAIQMLSSNGEPLQTMSPEKLLDKIESNMSEYIKNDNDRRAFVKQVIQDWGDGNISKEGMLSVNSIN